jgi:hypothetical protein
MRMATVSSLGRFTHELRIERGNALTGLVLDEGFLDEPHSSTLAIVWALQNFRRLQDLEPGVATAPVDADRAYHLLLRHPLGEEELRVVDASEPLLRRHFGEPYQDGHLIALASLEDGRGGTMGSSK